MVAVLRLWQEAEVLLPASAGRHDYGVVLGAEWKDRLVGLDDAAQWLALRVDHGPA